MLIFFYNFDDILFDLLNLRFNFRKVWFQSISHSCQYRYHPFNLIFHADTEWCLKLRLHFLYDYFNFTLVFGGACLKYPILKIHHSFNDDFDAFIWELLFSWFNFNVIIFEDFGDTIVQLNERTRQESFDLGLLKYAILFLHEEWHYLFVMDLKVFLKTCPWYLFALELLGIYHNYN